MSFSDGELVKFSSTMMQLAFNSNLSLCKATRTFFSPDTIVFQLINAFLNLKYIFHSYITLAS